MTRTQRRRDEQYKRDVQEWTEELVEWERRSMRLDATWSDVGPDSTPERIAAGEAAYTHFDQAYGAVLAQCARDLNDTLMMQAVRRDARLLALATA